MKVSKENRGRGNPKVNKNYLFNLIGLASLSSLNMKKVALINVILGVTNIEELYQACKNNDISELPGFGVATQKKIQSEIELSILWLNNQTIKVKKELNKTCQSSKENTEFLLSLITSQNKEN